MDYKVNNQVVYGDKLASIARVYESTADILVYNNEDDTEYVDGVNIEDLKPIEISPKVVKECKFCKKIVQGRTFIFEKGKYKVEVYDNGYYVICKEGMVTDKGMVKYLHELQNIITKLTNGHYIFI